ncbi:meiosis-specific protein ASY3 isoform X1 [Herrania umbratica]|uniref:Meiosis-specific protein ASY3 isoform X1 n=2 Tax=Herrania umbratica TaxID=108875 RepID=A0A6J1A2K6_9ROSI|nr:meiosis-specific protein ASY3 isoform X1 [Herrania umbratica]XP_021281386.1 meiosis-specific protein ASY3 isoform X1 [Herrania umbratica]XP_021281387.1 meiosis-specific protein ASY3 isoform X1 [Herrania umbratica]
MQQEIKCLMPCRFLFQDPMSDCRSFGSNYHPSSQSRKISIGVTVDSLSKRKTGTTKENEGKLPNTERTKPSTGISTEGKTKGEAVKTAKGRQTEDAELVKSPWITPRSFHKKSLASETVFFPEETSNCRQRKLNAVKDVALTHSVQFFPNQNLNPQNVGSNQNKRDGLTYKRKGGKDGNSQTVEDFKFSNAHREFLESDKVVVEDKADKRQNVQTEALKIKLRELLGTASSPKSQQSSSQSHEFNANNLRPEIITNNMGDTVAKPRQNSDTIETDSDNPDNTIKRPVTRSLTRKRTAAKVQPDKTKVGLSSNQKHRESIFSFGEGRPTKLDGSANSGSSLSGKMKIQKKSSNIDPRRICFPGKDNADEIQQTTYRSETSVPAEKTSLLGNKIESFPGSFNEKSKENFEKVQDKDPLYSPVINKTNQQVNFDNPTSPERGEKQEDLANISLRNVVHTQHDFQSPTFEFRTPTLNTSPSPTPKTVDIEQGDCSFVPLERGFTIGNIRSFRTFQCSRPVCNKSIAQSQSPDDTEKPIDSSLRNPMPIEENVDAVNEHSEPSSEERWSESFEEGSPIIKRYDCHRENITSPETVIAEKPNLVHCPIKRLQNHEDFRLSEFSPTSPSQKVGVGDGESFWFQEPSEQDQEDELTRAVTLFALALETFKQKMDSATRKKSSEILMSISEEIKSLLLNAESQIESDIGKLTSLSKTKRKRLETRFQEKQEQLKLILEKFMEDIHHHLLGCRSTLDGMETHQIELKGIMKKQKASHQKLLVHVEEAVEIQINNAERRITAVHESAREKMLQLKHVIAECLKDGIY